jgi:hypothetical protein
MVPHCVSSHDVIRRKSRVKKSVSQRQILPGIKQVLQAILQISNPSAKPVLVNPWKRARHRFQEFHHRSRRPCASKRIPGSTAGFLLSDRFVELITII